MGGTVAETIRRENGEVIKMARKTGAYNWLFFSKEFNNGEIDKAIDNHIQIFLEMREDYLAETNKFPMSGAYGWCNQLAPVGYGLVVIDFQTKKIHSLQGYDTPGDNHLTRLSSVYINDKKDEDDFEFLISNNKLDIYSFEKDEKIGDVESIFGKHTTLSSLRKTLEKKRKDFSFAMNKVKPKVLNDFKIISYDETPYGVLEMLTALTKDSFNLNEEEKQSWLDFAQDYDDEYFAMDDESLNDDEYEQLIEQEKSKFFNQFKLVLE